MRTIIVDDEYSPRFMLSEKLKLLYPSIEIVRECEDAEEAIIETLRLRPDLLFLDIQMPGKDGLWLADELMRMRSDTFTPPDIIFTTGYTYSEYLLKAFELAAIDYLVKPVGELFLKKAIERHIERAETTTGLQNLMNAISEEKLLKFKSYNGLLFVKPEDIVYVSADGDYANMFYTNGTKEYVFERLGEIEKKLSFNIFIRVGKSIVINKKYIHKITNESIQLLTQQANYSVKISRNAANELKEKI